MFTPEENPDFYIESLTLNCDLTENDLCFKVHMGFKHHGCLLNEQCVLYFTI